MELTIHIYVHFPDFAAMQDVIAKINKVAGGQDVAAETLSTAIKQNQGESKL